MTDFHIAQFSDCHLFSDIDGLHYGANVYQNLCLILNDIANNPNINIAIFTGDLTQDHSEASYQLFVKAIEQSKLTIPLYFLAGNHDDITLMERVLTASDSVKSDVLDEQYLTVKCSNEKLITTDYWAIALLNSKSGTPAGIVDEPSLKQISELSTLAKHTLLCMHHHPIDVGFGIDKHGLMNKAELWQAVDNNPYVKGVVCGHVHNAFHLEKTFDAINPNTNTDMYLSTVNRNVTVYTCPATSVEFNTEFTTSETLESSPITEKGAGYQMLSLADNGNITRTVKYFPANFTNKSSN